MAPLPSGEERPTKAPKQNEKPAPKAALKKQKQLQNQKPLSEYIVGRKEVWEPNREFGYNTNGKNSDPNSNRQKNKGDCEGGECPKGKGKGKGQKGGNVEASINTVRETSLNQSLDSKICVLDGTNLRQLRDGLGLCSPVIIQPGERQCKKFWNEISKVLSEV